MLGIWRDLEYTNKLSPRCHIQQWAFLNLFLHTLKSPNFNKRKNKAKMLLLKHRERYSVRGSPPLLCIRQVSATQQQEPNLLKPYRVIAQLDIAKVNNKFQTHKKNNHK